MNLYVKVEFKTPTTEQVRRGMQQFKDRLRVVTPGLAGIAETEQDGRTRLRFEFAEPAHAYEFAARMSAMLGKDLEIEPGSEPLPPVKSGN